MYCHAFLEHEISGAELMSLEKSDFKDVGVTKVSFNKNQELFTVHSEKARSTYVLHQKTLKPYLRPAPLICALFFRKLEIDRIWRFWRFQCIRKHNILHCSTVTET